MKQQQKKGTKMSEGMRKVIYGKRLKTLDLFSLPRKALR